MPPKINIALLTDCLADTNAGAEKQIVELAKRLNASRYEVFVCSLDATGGSALELEKILGKPLHIFKVIRIYGLSGLVQGWKFICFLKKNRIDVLQTYHFGSDIWGTFWGKLAGVKVVISNRRDMGFWRGAQHIRTYCLLNRWVKKIVVVAASVKDIVAKEEGVPREKIQVIYNGVDRQEISAAEQNSFKKDLGLLSEEHIILHVANLRPVKGHTYLLRAFAEIVTSFPKWSLLLVGEDQLKGELARLVQELHMDKNVKFLGKRQDVGKILAAADICVLPSLSEGMSNAVLEYMAAGKPVVATSVGGNPELVKDGYNGFLVPKEDSSALRKALLLLMQDPQKRISMGQNGLKRAREEFSFERMITAYQDIYREALT